MVKLMEDVCTKENLGQSLLVPATVLQQYDDIAVEVENQGGNEIAARAVAAMVTMDYVTGLRKFWEKEMRKKDRKKQSCSNCKSPWHFRSGLLL